MTEMDAEILAYAREILKNAGCDEHTYALVPDEQIMDDLKTAFPGGMKFPYVDVANAIIAVSTREPIHRARWRVVYDTAHCTDEFGVETLDEAKNGVFDCYFVWMEEEMHTESLESWNSMIYSCAAIVEKYDPDTDEYEEYWYPSQEELEEIGWRELTEEEFCPVSQYRKEE